MSSRSDLGGFKTYIFVKNSKFEDRFTFITATSFFNQFSSENFQFQRWEFSWPEIGTSSSNLAFIIFNLYKMFFKKKVIEIIRSVVRLADRVR